MSDAMDQLLDVMQRLRDPNSGCPWDIKQTYASLAKYVLEESYEVIETIEQNDTTHLCEELGDLLLQIVFLSQIAKENQHFTFDDVARGEAEKMIERHPHVFGNRTGVDNAEKVLQNWEKDKLEKRQQAALEAQEKHSLLDDISTALPAMLRAVKLQKRMAQGGFDWPRNGNEIDANVIAKIHEELDELGCEINKGAENKDRIASELGDVLFAIINLSRHLRIDPEEALRHTNRKVERRFRYIEDQLDSQGRRIEESSLSEMESLWQKAKQDE
ncbi:MAG: nucleoside triphosphate pyrophosphohydrolase [Proteobacteria bacterium]|nr:nucleoside triphosphate pyrophosphohydrolase [Alphaproteobacteria bacterium]NCC02574.1 nucleoside triphosphate pyrophosphohydrolase [Pseudomonadota bacterium]